MTIINIKVNEKEKKQIQEFSAARHFKSASEFIRQAVAEKILLDQHERADSEDSSIPDYIPPNKFVALVKGVVVAIGDNPSEVTRIAMEKFSQDPIIVKYNGVLKRNPPEYVYIALETPECWHYLQFQGKTYPLLPIFAQIQQEKFFFSALLDNAASVC